MLKQDICLGALTKLGINYDLENYESSESYKVALREFEKNIYNATQNINTELLKKEVVLTSAYGIPNKTYKNIELKAYLIPNDFITMFEIVDYVYEFADGYIFIDVATENPALLYYCFKNPQEISQNYRVYFEYYLASEIAVVLNRESLQQAMFARANYEISNIKGKEKPYKKEYDIYGAYADDVKLY